jgi:small subunit ribosomal protein S20
MARHKSAIRQLRRSIRRNAVNKQNKSGLRTEVKKLKEAVENKDKEGIKKLLPDAFSVIDKAVKKKSIHRRKGDRVKSRLSRRVEKAISAPSQ